MVNASTDWTFSTVNYYKTPRNPGATYPTGAAWLAALNGGSSNRVSPPTVNVYLTPGEHFINGRRWRTQCVPYSQTERCTTEIWATTTKV
ncbi:MAG TPA: hypothetical protein GX013_05635, partial [Propionibacterium sp.]|nr:hypothetical protein [Propionibacterium sp.]